MFKLYLQPDYVVYGCSILSDHEELKLKHWDDGGITSEDGLETELERILIANDVRYAVLREEDKQCLDYIRQNGRWEVPKVQRIPVRGERRLRKRSVG